MRIPFRRGASEVTPPTISKASYSLTVTGQRISAFRDLFHYWNPPVKLSEPAPVPLRLRWSDHSVRVEHAADSRLITTLSRSKARQLVDTAPGARSEVQLALEIEERANGANGKWRRGTFTTVPARALTAFLEATAQKGDAVAPGAVAEIKDDFTEVPAALTPVEGSRFAHTNNRGETVETAIHRAAHALREADGVGIPASVLDGASQHVRNADEAARMAPLVEPLLRHGIFPDTATRAFFVERVLSESRVDSSAQKHPWPHFMEEVAKPSIKAEAALDQLRQANHHSNQVEGSEVVAGALADPGLDQTRFATEALPFARALGLNEHEAALVNARSGGSLEQVMTSLAELRAERAKSNAPALAEEAFERALALAPSLIDAPVEKQLLLDSLEEAERAVGSTPVLRALRETVRATFTTRLPAAKQDVARSRLGQFRAELSGACENPQPVLVARAIQRTAKGLDAHEQAAALHDIQDAVRAAPSLRTAEVERAWADLHFTGALSKLESRLEQSGEEAPGVAYREILEPLREAARLLPELSAFPAGMQHLQDLLDRAAKALRERDSLPSTRYRVGPEPAELARGILSGTGSGTRADAIAQALDAGRELEAHELLQELASLPAGRERAQAVEALREGLDARAPLSAVLACELEDLLQEGLVSAALGKLRGLTTPLAPNAYEVLRAFREAADAHARVLRPETRLALRKEMEEALSMLGPSYGREPRLLVERLAGPVVEDEPGLRLSRHAELRPAPGGNIEDLARELAGAQLLGNERLVSDLLATPSAYGLTQNNARAVLERTGELLSQEGTRLAAPLARGLDGLSVGAGASAAALELRALAEKLRLSPEMALHSDSVIPLFQMLRDGIGAAALPETVGPWLATLTDAEDALRAWESLRNQQRGQSEQTKAFGRVHELADEARQLANPEQQIVFW